jgi:hypothetical protein
MITDLSKAVSERGQKFRHFLGAHGWWILILIALCGLGIFIWLMATKPLSEIPLVGTHETHGRRNAGDPVGRRRLTVRYRSQNRHRV